MYEQLSLFDFIEGYPKVRFSPVIDMLSKDIKEICPDLCNESYEVWDHVPRLGKRYSGTVILNKGDTDKIDKLIDLFEKYKKYTLDVSLNGGFDNRFYIFTIWDNKGYKEHGL